MQITRQQIECLKTTIEWYRFWQLIWDSGATDIIEFRFSKYALPYSYAYVRSVVRMKLCLLRCIFLCFGCSSTASKTYDFVVDRLLVFQNSISFCVSVLWISSHTTKASHILEQCIELWIIRLSAIVFSTHPASYVLCAHINRHHYGSSFICY